MKFTKRFTLIQIMSYMEKAKEIIGTFVTAFLLLSMVGWFRTGSFSEIPFYSYLPIAAIFSLIKVYLLPYILPKKKS